MKNYSKYIEHLNLISASTHSANENKSAKLPIFSDIKRIANHYESTLDKFKKCSNEFAEFIERKSFDDNDFDYYQDKFLKLKETDKLLTELKNKQAPYSLKSELDNFINSKYDNTSLYDLSDIENEVYSYHNKIVDVNRYEKHKEDNANQNRKNMTLLIIAVAVITLIIIFMNI